MQKLILILVIFFQVKSLNAAGFSNSNYITIGIVNSRINFKKNKKLKFINYKSEIELFHDLSASVVDIAILSGEYSLMTAELNLEIELIGKAEYSKNQKIAAQDLKNKTYAVLERSELAYQLEKNKVSLEKVSTFQMENLLKYNSKYKLVTFGFDSYFLMKHETRNSYAEKELIKALKKSEVGYSEIKEKDKEYFKDLSQYMLLSLSKENVQHFVDTFYDWYK